MLHSYLAKRIAAFCVSVWGGVTIVFFLVRLTGNPVRLLLPPQATAQEAARLTHALGFDQPLLVQYGHFLHDLITGHLGQSLYYQSSAVGLILERAPATIELTAGAMAIAVAIGVPAGLVSAARHGSVLDTAIRTVIMTAQALPVFWVGIILIFFLAVRVHAFPPEGRAGLESLILPAVTLSVYPTAAVARLTRSSVLDVLGEEYIRTAELKGLTHWRIVWRHALRNALAPVITIIALQVGTLLGGAVVTETVFAWPGVGLLSIQAVENRDFPLVQVIVVVAIVVVSAANLLADLAYAVADPRVRYAS